MFFVAVAVDVVAAAAALGTWEKKEEEPWVDYMLNGSIMHGWMDAEVSQQQEK